MWLTIKTVAFRSAKIDFRLLIKSDLEEFAELWSLLGDLIRPDEDIESAPYRVLKERTGLDDVYLEQVYTFGALNRHPSGRVITTVYYSLIDVNHHKGDHQALYIEKDQLYAMDYNGKKTRIE